MRTLPALRAFPLPRRPTFRWRGRAVAVTTVGALALAATASYIVQPGDTLSAIAVANGSSVAEIAALNGIHDPDRILAGQELTLPEPAEAGPAPAAGASVDDVGALLETTARAYGFSPRFVKAIAWQESGWQQDQVSSAGAIGIMQVMPGTGRFVSTELAGRDLDLDDPADNVEAGVRFLDYLWDLTGGDVELTLAGYYQGLASVSANGWYDDTERYVANVLALRDRF